MIDDILKNAKTRMAKSVESLEGELSRMRTGRAHPSLLEHVKVDYYGSETPLSQVTPEHSPLRRGSRRWLPPLKKPLSIQT